MVTLLFVSLTGMLACQSNTVSPQPPQTGLIYQSDFQSGNDGWTADVSDYGTAQASLIDFKSAWSGLPGPLNTSRKAMMLSGMNRSDDLFMFLKKKLTGLQPNTDYKLVFDLELASSYATNSFGIGGSPGSSVYLKAGATTTEPAKQLRNNFYEMNIDKGNQSTSGRDAVVLGDVSAGPDVTTYKLITRSNADKPFVVRTNGAGELWLLVGTDSGYEGLTTLYYSAIKVTAK